MEENIFLLSQYGFFKLPILGILIIGDIEENDLLRFKNKLNNDYPKNKIRISKDYKELIDLKELIIVTASKITKKYNIEKFMKLQTSKTDQFLASMFITDLKIKESKEDPLEKLILSSIKVYKLFNQKIIKLKNDIKNKKFAKKFVHIMIL